MCVCDGNYPLPHLRTGRAATLFTQYWYYFLFFRFFLRNVCLYSLSSGQSPRRPLCIQYLCIATGTLYVLWSIKKKNKTTTKKPKKKNHRQHHRSSTPFLSSAGRSERQHEGWLRSRRRRFRSRRRLRGSGPWRTIPRREKGAGARTRLNFWHEEVSRDGLRVSGDLTRLSPRTSAFPWVLTCAPKRIRCRRCAPL